MGVKGDNLELISGLLLSSFMLNYMLIRVNEKGFLNKKKRKNREREKRSIKRRERRGKQSFGKVDFWITNSSVEVGYGLCCFIVNS